MVIYLLSTQALRAKCLLQLGARGEALAQAADAVRPTAAPTPAAGAAAGKGGPIIPPTVGGAAWDPDVLAAACGVFRALGQDNEVVGAYKNALSALPDAAPLLRGLTSAYLRMGDWKNVQVSKACKRPRAKEREYTED